MAVNQNPNDSLQQKIGTIDNVSGSDAVFAGAAKALYEQIVAKVTADNPSIQPGTTEFKAKIVEVAEPMIDKSAQGNALSKEAAEVLKASIKQAQDADSFAALMQRDRDKLAAEMAAANPGSKMDQMQEKLMAAIMPMLEKILVAFGVDPKLARDLLGGKPEEKKPAAPAAVPPAVAAAPAPAAEPAPAVVAPAVPPAAPAPAQVADAGQPGFGFNIDDLVSQGGQTVTPPTQVAATAPKIPEGFPGIDAFGGEPPQVVAKALTLDDPDTVELVISELLAERSLKAGTDAGFTVDVSQAGPLKGDMRFAQATIDGEAVADAQIRGLDPSLKGVDFTNGGLTNIRPAGLKEPMIPAEHDALMSKAEVMLAKRWKIDDAEMKRLSQWQEQFQAQQRAGEIPADAPSPFEQFERDHLASLSPQERQNTKPLTFGQPDDLVAAAPADKMPAFGTQSWANVYGPNGTLAATQPQTSAPTPKENEMLAYLGLNDHGLQVVRPAAGTDTAPAAYVPSVNGNTDWTGRVGLKLAELTAANNGPVAVPPQQEFSTETGDKPWLKMEERIPVSPVQPSGSQPLVDLPGKLNVDGGLKNDRPQAPIFRAEVPAGAAFQFDIMKSNPLRDGPFTAAVQPADFKLLDARAIVAPVAELPANDAKFIVAAGAKI